MGAGGIFGPLLPGCHRSPTRTWCSRWTVGVGVSPLSLSGRHPPLRQRVKKDSLMLLAAALAPLLCSVTPGSEVRAQLWPRIGGGRLQERGGLERCPLAAGDGSCGAPLRISVPLCPSPLPRGHGPCALLPLHKCPSGGTGVKICWA